jgi:nicotinate-nucleotide adenylyltransferase
MRKIAVFGGSFNPPHVAHALAVHYVSMAGGFDDILVIPTFVHPNDKPLIDFNHRIRMCQLAFSSIPKVIIDPIESTLPTPSYSVNTFKALHKQFPADYRFVVGSDILFNKELWTDIDEVFRLAPPFIIGRLGYPATDVTEQMVLPGVSSTEIRNLLKCSRYGQELNKIMPERVLQYIQEHGLYTEEE